MDAGPSGGGQGWLRPVASATAVVRRKRPANGDGSGPGAAGSRGFRGKDAVLMAGSRVDSHEIRGLCFLCLGSASNVRRHQEPLQLLVLGLQLPQPFGLADLHAAEFALPAVDRVLADAMSARQVPNPGAGCVLLQDGNDLLVGVLLALHFGTSLGQNYREIPHPAWLELWGYGHL
jgi:hypothetical protein